MRLEAPLMSFGAPIVDNIGTIQAFPSLSQLCGMLANALGYYHSEFDSLNTLQSQLLYSVCCLQSGEKITDYQTVDLGQNFMIDRGWTTKHQLEVRAGGSSKGTHIRNRDYWANASFLVAIKFKSENDSLKIADIAEALQRPARPLFIGRKCCIPSTKLFEALVESDSTLAAIESYVSNTLGHHGEFEVWSSEIGLNEADYEETMVTDERDWENQIHVGQRSIRHGLLKLEAKR
jgi:CRISPR system Cascade subunit CasD